MCLETFQFLFRASVGMDFRRRFSYDVLLSHLFLSQIKWDDYKHLTKVVTTASLRVVRETLGIQKDGHGFCITKDFSKSTYKMTALLTASVPKAA